MQQASEYQVNELHVLMLAKIMLDIIVNGKGRPLLSELQCKLPCRASKEIVIISYGLHNSAEFCVGFKSATDSGPMDTRRLEQFR